MKDFFTENYIEIFQDGTIGIIVGIIFWIVTSLLLCIVVYGSLYIIDSSFRPINEGVGIVVEKEFIPEHIQTIMVYNAATKTTTPQMTHFSDEWKVYVEINNIIGCKSVSEDIYNKIKENQKVNIRYSYGRIWRTLYIKELIKY